MSNCHWRIPIKNPKILVKRYLKRDIWISNKMAHATNWHSKEKKKGLYNAFLSPWNWLMKYSVHHHNASAHISAHQCSLNAWKTITCIYSDIFIHLIYSFSWEKRVNNQCRQRSVKEERLLAVLVWFLSWDLLKLLKTLSK